jgi:ATP-dependent helicase HrpA
MRMTDLMRREAAEVTRERFPDALQVGASALPLEYHFDPGHAADGVTLVVPLPLINQVSPERGEWLVPGLLEERVVALLRGLPKQIRKSFVPIPDTAARVVERLSPSDRPLTQAVGEALKDLTGVSVPESAWDPAAVPAHLNLKYRLVDPDGTQVAAGDDLIALKRRYGETGQRSFAHIPSAGLERDGITRWDFGTLPESLDLERGGIRLRGYPALVDRGESVAVQVLDSPESAELAGRAGLRRLFMLSLGAEMRRLRQGLPALERMRLQYALAPQPPAEDRAAARPPDLADELIDLILDLTFTQGQPPIRDQATFAARLAARRGRLATVAGEVARLAGGILGQYQALRKRLAEITQVHWQETVGDVRAQLDGLVFRGFLGQIPYERLRDYPRYLRAAEQRLDRLLHAAARDRERMQELAPLAARWSERASAMRAAGRRDPRLEEIRWMLEELRVSLFAQQLGTAYPVSVKRIEGRWRELGL